MNKIKQDPIFPFPTPFKKEFGCSHKVIVLENDKIFDNLPNVIKVYKCVDCKTKFTINKISNPNFINF